MHSYETLVCDQQGNMYYNGKYKLEYVWVDKKGNPRSKVKTFEKRRSIDDVSSITLQDVPVWNFDGSSTEQNVGQNTEVVLIPVRLYYNPLEDTETLYCPLLVLCELSHTYPTQNTVYSASSPSSSSPTPPPPAVDKFNTRKWAKFVADKFAHMEPLYGCEQEYSILDPKTCLPYRWEEYGSEKQGDFYCSVKYPYCQGEQFVKEHYNACLKCGIAISGYNAEVLPSQWEYQIGPQDLLKVADDMIMARYLLYRLSAKYDMLITFNPKPLKTYSYKIDDFSTKEHNDWNGSGCHINFSTNDMRAPGGIIHIENAIVNLSKNHKQILQHYGDNRHRLTGHHETSNPEIFTHGVGTRNTSVRIPNQVSMNGYGYFEDRRPASDIDPYLALAALLEICMEGELVSLVKIENNGKQKQ